MIHMHLAAFELNAFSVNLVHLFFKFSCMLKGDLFNIYDIHIMLIIHKLFNFINHMYLILCNFVYTRLPPQGVWNSVSPAVRNHIGGSHFYDARRDQTVCQSQVSYLFVIFESKELLVKVLRHK